MPKSSKYHKNEKKQQKNKKTIKVYDNNNFFETLRLKLWNLSLRNVWKIKDTLLVQVFNRKEKVQLTKTQKFTQSFPEKIF